METLFGQKILNTAIFENGSTKKDDEKDALFRAVQGMEERRQKPANREPVGHAANEAGEKELEKEEKKAKETQLVFFHEKKG